MPFFCQRLSPPPAPIGGTVGAAGELLLTAAAGSRGQNGVWARNRAAERRVTTTSCRWGLWRPLLVRVGWRRWLALGGGGGGGLALACNERIVFLDVLQRNDVC